MKRENEKKKMKRFPSNTRFVHLILFMLLENKQLDLPSLNHDSHRLENARSIPSTHTRS